jgi:hypothetical protein
VGYTNLLSGLRTKYASLSGEAEGLAAHIAQIKVDYAKLDELESRLATLKTAADHIVAVIHLLDETWDPRSVKAVKRYSRRLPMRPGECSATALDIIRTAERWMTAREIAMLVLNHHGIKNADAKLRQRVTNTVDATLRGHNGKTIVCDDSWPKRWRADRGLGRGR